MEKVYYNTRKGISRLPSGDKQDVDNKVSVISNDIVFEDSYFKFELAETKKFDEVHHIGTFICTWIISRSKNKNRRSSIW
jgi:hypothetical protein